MSPKPDPKFKLPSRPASAKEEAAFAELEKRTEERGNGVAGGPAVRPSAKGSKLRRDQRGERVAGYLPAELERELRLFCARERRSVSDALTEAVKLLLERQKDTDI